MKSGLIAVAPFIKAGGSFDSFCETLRLFQAHGLITRTSIGSVVHPDLYSAPYRLYDELLETYVKEARANVQAACAAVLSHGTVKILTSRSPGKEDHVSLLTRCARRLGHDLLIFASSDRTGLSHLILGSHSETASLMAPIPVLVIKPSFERRAFARQAHFVLTVDAASPPSAQAVRWIADFARPARATIDLLYVRPRQRLLVDSLQNRKSRHEAEETLGKTQSAFAKLGLEAKPVVLEESGSVAETAAAYSEKTKAWVVMTTEAARTRPRKLLIGSTARKILMNSRRPFLSLRMA